MKLFDEPMIPFHNGSYEKHGMDVLKVYRPDETSVIKFRRLDADTRWYVDAFNELFGERTRYEILGEEVWDGTPVLKLRQPYVEFGECTWEDARKELFYEMKRRFGDAEEHPWMPNELHLPGWFLDDLKDANVGIDVQTQHYAVIDCIIHRTETINPALFFDIDKKWLADKRNYDTSR